MTLKGLLQYKFFFFSSKTSYSYFFFVDKTEIVVYVSPLMKTAQYGTKICFRNISQGTSIYWVLYIHILHTNIERIWLWYAGYDILVDDILAFLLWFLNTLKNTNQNKTLNTLMLQIHVFAYWPRTECSNICISCLWTIATWQNIHFLVKKNRYDWEISQPKTAVQVSYVCGGNIYPVLGLGLTMTKMT
jgi:hypothetical protein